MGRRKEEERRRRHGGEELVSRERFPHQQLFAATPSVEAKKNLFRVTGAENPGRKKKAREDEQKLMFVDVKNAHFVPPCRDEVFVELPSEFAAHGRYAKLQRWLF